MLHTRHSTVAVDNTGADITLATGTETVHNDDHAGPQGKAEAVRKNIREVADRVTHLVDEHAPDVVFITGEVSARSELLSELPRAGDRKVCAALQGGGRTAGTDADEVRHEMDQSSSSSGWPRSTTPPSGSRPAWAPDWRSRAPPG